MIFCNYFYYFIHLCKMKGPAQLLIAFPDSFYHFVHTLFGKTTGFCQIVSLLPNCIRLSPFSHFSTAFTDKIIYLSAKNHNILFLLNITLRRSRLSGVATIPVAQSHYSSTKKSWFWSCGNHYIDSLYCSHAPIGVNTL